jgi:hypothetical protein
MPRDLQPAFARKTKARTVCGSRAFRSAGLLATLYFTRKIERNAKKLLQALALGLASGIGKAVGAALVTYLLAQLASWLLR